MEGKNKVRVYKWPTNVSNSIRNAIVFVSGKDPIQEWHNRLDHSSSHVLPLFSQ